MKLVFCRAQLPSAKSPEGKKKKGSQAPTDWLRAPRCPSMALCCEWKVLGVTLLTAFGASGDGGGGILPHFCPRGQQGERGSGGEGPAVQEAAAGPAARSRAEQEAARGGRVLLVMDGKGGEGGVFQKA